MMIPNAVRERIRRALAEHTHARRTIADAEREAAAARAAAGHAVDGQKVVQTVAAAMQHNAHIQIAKVVTHAVRQVGWDYEFVLEFTRKRGRTDARPGFVRNGVRISPTGAAGGGPVDVAALALRVAALRLRSPKRRPVLILDEPFRGINGDDHRRRAALTVRSLAEKLGIQFIIATGHEWLTTAGRVIRM